MNKLFFSLQLFFECEKDLDKKGNIICVTYRTFSTALSGCFTGGVLVGGGGGEGAVCLTKANQHSQQYMGVL